jgi:DNA helicase-2/ATP-dependent DNA helicase PcrA
MRRYVLRTERPAPQRLDLERTLNESQRNVVLSRARKLLVIAGAGTGKTRTLTYRAAHLIAGGLDPQRLLLCTFTSRAAREMVQRVEALLDAELRPRWAGTFHHIANVGLRKYASHLGLDERYTILDREDARDLMGSCLAEEGSTLALKRFPRAPLLQHLASTSVNCERSIDEVVVSEAPRFHQMTEDIDRVLRRFSQRKRTLGLVDYDDLLVHFRTLLEEHPEPARDLSTTFEQILVDEYQDTDRLQATIVERCASVHGNLTVVGDDAQSIYAFRGAHLANMVEFTERYPEAETHKLELNYRSAPEILQLANRSIRNNVRQIPKQLRTERPAGMKPVLLPLQDVYQQAAFVAQRLLELHQEDDIGLGQIAVLYRAHSHSMELQLELVRRNIPFSVRSGARFFEQAHIKDVTAYLRLIHNVGDVLAWQRILRTWSGVGRRSASLVLERLLETPHEAAPRLLSSPDLVARLPGSARTACQRLAQLLAELASPQPLGELIEHILDAHYRDYASSAFPNAETRLEDLRQLADYGRRYESLESFLSEMSLVSEFAAEGVAPGQQPEESLTLSTIHQAKGLEWRAVFLIGLSEGRFPAAMATRTPADLEEERRLFYVAATRAKDQLYLCFPRFEEPQSGPRRIQRLSRFIEELSYDGHHPYERWEVA